MPRGADVTPFVWADVDLDGRLEVLVLHRAGGPSLMGDSGSGTIEDRTSELGLSGLPALSRALFHDADRDGDPDLFVVARDGSGRLLRNERELGFQDVSAESGLELAGGLVDASWRDVDGDGMPDLFLVTQAGARLARGLGGCVLEDAGETPFALPTGLTAIPHSESPEPSVDPLAPSAPSAPVVHARTASPSRSSEDLARAAGSPETGSAHAAPRNAGELPGSTAALGAGSACAKTIRDQNTGTCIQASSMPAVGSLYPISSDLFVDATTGHVGLNTLSPDARLEIDAAGDTGLSVRSSSLGAALVELSSPNTNALTPTLFVKTGGGGTAGYFQEKLAVGTLFTGLPSPRATLGIDATDNAELRMIGSNVETVELLANEVDGNGAQLELRMASGQPTITLDAEAGSAAAEVSIFDSLGKETVQIRSESSVEGTGGQLALRRTEGPNAIVMEAATSRGAELSMRDSSSIETVEIISEESGGGSQLLLNRGNGFPSIVMDAQQGAASQFSMYNSNAIEAVELVAEEGTGDGAQLVLKKYDGTVSIILDASQGADGRITTETLEITGGSDLVEGFDSDEACTPGSVVVMDPNRPGALTLARTPYDARVAGVVSGAGAVRPGLRLGQRDVLDGDTLVALTGRVYVRCTDENGPVRPGDLLTSSSTPGHAMRATDPLRAFGAVIGKAMGALEGESGLVLVLVGLQ